MNSEVIGRDGPFWSRRRWLTTFAVLFLAQIGALVYFGEPPHNIVRAMRSPTSLYLPVDDWSARQIADSPTLDDPTLFALPSLHGFSGKAWLTFPAINYQMKDWTEPPAYLVIDRDRLAKTFTSFAATNEPAPTEMFANPTANLLNLQITIPPLNVRTASELRVEGALEKRRLIETVHLPSWPNDDLLTNSVVQLLVNQAGDPISTVLLSSSTSKEADNFALKFAAAARFEPFRSGASENYSSGRFIFQWHTVPVPETNSLSPRP